MTALEQESNESVRTVMSIGTREFELNSQCDEKDLIFKALEQAFNEIDEVKKENVQLRLRLNMLTKRI